MPASAAAAAAFKPNAAARQLDELDQAAEHFEREAYAEGTRATTSATGTPSRTECHAQVSPRFPPRLKRYDGIWPISQAAVARTRPLPRTHTRTSIELARKHAGAAPQDPRVRMLERGSRVLSRRAWKPGAPLARSSVCDETNNPQGQRQRVLCSSAGADTNGARRRDYRC